MDKIIDKNKKIDIGLTKEEVEERIKENKVNYDTSLPTKSIKTIVRENIFTLFNLINILLGVAVFCVGSYKNLLFLIPNRLRSFATWRNVKFVVSVS